MKPFLILQLRPETDAADGEFATILDKCALPAGRVHRIRLDCEDLPAGIDVTAYSGVIVGGGPGCALDIGPVATPPMTAGPSNTARFDLPIPSVQALVGLNLYGQGAVLEPAGSSSVLTTTNALLLQIGSR